MPGCVEKRQFARTEINAAIQYRIAGAEMLHEGTMGNIGGGNLVVGRAGTTGRNDTIPLHPPLGRTGGDRTGGNGHHRACRPHQEGWAVWLWLPVRSALQQPPCGLSPSSGRRMPAKRTASAALELCRRENRGSDRRDLRSAGCLRATTSVKGVAQQIAPGRSGVFRYPGYQPESGFFHRYAASPDLKAANEPCPADTIAALFLDRWVVEYDRAVLITLSQTLSALFQNATEAWLRHLRGYREKRRLAGLLTPFHLNADSRTVFAGEAVLADAAIRLLRDQDLAFNELRRRIEEFRRYVRCYILPGDLPARAPGQRIMGKCA